MLKRHHRFFQSLQVFRDAVLVAAAFALAFWVRFSLPDLLPFETVSPRQETIWVAMTLVFAWPAVGWLCGLYVSRRTRSVAAEVFDVCRTSVITFLVLVTVTYFFRDERFSRGTLILWSVFSTLFIAAVRVISRVILRTIRMRGYNLRHVVVVGTGVLAKRVIESMQAQASLGIDRKSVV